MAEARRVSNNNSSSSSKLQEPLRQLQALSTTDLATNITTTNTITRLLVAYSRQPNTTATLRTSTMQPLPPLITALSSTTCNTVKRRRARRLQPPQQQQWWPINVPNIISSNIFSSSRLIIFTFSEPLVSLIVKHTTSKTTRASPATGKVSLREYMYIFLAARLQLPVVSVLIDLAGRKLCVPVALMLPLPPPLLLANHHHYHQLRNKWPFELMRG